MEELLLLFIGGLLAGTLGGLLGIGGGVVLMPLLRFIVGLSPARAAGTCILAVFFTTLGGSYRHYRLGHVDLRSIVPIVVSGAVATVVFSVVFLYLAAPAREQWLDLAIGLVFSLIAARMVYEGIPGLVGKREEEGGSTKITDGLVNQIVVGGVAGALPGLFGIGTGVILVPAFTYIFGAPIKIAMASSLTCFSFNALISSIFKLAQGFMNLEIALPVCIGTLIGANLGAILNKRSAPYALKLILGVIFLYVSLKFILSFFGVTM